MSDNNKQIEEFRQFASGKLNTHKRELQTRYENEEVEKETLKKAYAEHSKILEQELKGQADILLSGQDNPWLKTELEHITKLFVEQLSKQNL